MDADTIAKIFDGKITKWNDPAIADQNKDLAARWRAIWLNTLLHRTERRMISWRQPPSKNRIWAA